MSLEGKSCEAAAACWLVRDKVGRGAEAGLRGKREGRRWSRVGRRWSGRGRATRSLRDALTVGVAGAEAGGRSAFVAGRSQGEATVGSGLAAVRRLSFCGAGVCFHQN